MAAALVVGVFYRIVAGSDGAKDPYTLYFYAATAGTIALLVAYAMVTVGCDPLPLLAAAPAGWPTWEIILPLGALAVVGYVDLPPDGSRRRRARARSGTPRSG